METIRVCLYQNTIVYFPGETIGIYSVAPSVISRAGKHQFTAGAYSVRSAETGMTIAAFFKQRIARNFAGMLMRVYGDISETLQHCYNQCETASDAALLDAIQAQSFHQCRVRKGMIVPYIHVNYPVLPSPEQATKLDNPQQRTF